MRRHPRSPLFPYTTLFRSYLGNQAAYKQREASDTSFQNSGRGAGCLVGGSKGEIYASRDGVRYKPVQNHDSHTAEKVVGRYKDRKSTRLNSSHVKISYAVF